MNERVSRVLPVLAAVAVAGTIVVGAACARAAGGTTTGKRLVVRTGTPVRAKAPPPIPLDSLRSEQLPRGFIAAKDLASLTRLRREVEYSANQFRRYVGAYPPPVRIAAVGDVDPARVNAGRLLAQGVDLVVTDWPAPGAQASSGFISDRIARWSLVAWERAKATGSAPAGKSRLTPDWFASAIAELAKPPADQNRDFEWMRAHLDEHVPIARLIEMDRPAAPAVAPAVTPAEDTKPGLSPPIRVRAGGNARVTARPAAKSGAKVAAADPGPTTQLFDAQSLAFARFLSVREDERFLGLWYEIVLTGQPQSAAFNIAKTMLSSPASLEKEWLAWMKDPAAAKPQ